MGLTNTPSAPPSQPATETRPQGGRKGNRPEEELPALDKNTGGASAPNGVSGLVPTSDMKMPGVTPGTDEKESLKIKIHLNLHARVRLDLDAQIYGDVVIGLL
ncbi:hypothetical protein NUU61_001784 [Penicillium alfredii]|uniref:Uncharacterized protein n=1 Tax=Penicillium alfredii TaxID=1506179 RepID=A0A9W9FQY5_9EURO|nr:uncharacterized protein NUU61_001784 [Penicillium alfredii]KAJ5104437.1 hypothetical protein NUU61_001784 [Penicillium alfredii]